MNKKIKKVSMLLTMVAASLLGTVSCNNQGEKKFVPSLDTTKKLTLNVYGYFENFEAFDLVTNDFNEFYPNIDFSYRSISSGKTLVNLQNDEENDIFMISKDKVGENGEGMYDYMLDLKEAKVDLSNIDEIMLSANEISGTTYSVPIGQIVYGIVVNVSLLKKYNLNVPTNYNEFLNCLEVMKQNRYVPLQGPIDRIFSELTINAMVNEIQRETSFLEVKKDENKLKSIIESLLDKIDYIRENGYSLDEINNLYPYDNYDKAILRFFDGEVPFWVCDTEKVSGMKKRESKSQKFDSEPFEYTYIYAPLGEKGAYAYHEPWNGFAVNKKSKRLDYAIEFINFLATTKELNKIADVKRIPSVAKNKSKGMTIYKNINNPTKLESECIPNEYVGHSDVTIWYNIVKKYVSGRETKENSINNFVEHLSNK